MAAALTIIQNLKSSVRSVDLVDKVVLFLKTIVLALGDQVLVTVNAAEEIVLIYDNQRGFVTRAPQTGRTQSPIYYIFQPYNLANTGY